MAAEKCGPKKVGKNSIYCMLHVFIFIKIMRIYYLSYCMFRDSLKKKIVIKTSGPKVKKKKKSCDLVSLFKGQ